MNELQIFENEKFGKVRTLSIESKPYFVGKDVATILGYSNPNEALQDHVDEEDKLNSKTLSSFILDLGQRGGWLINESGLYSLILSSKLPNAKKFKRWVTDEVLPSIHKHGAYMTPQTLEQAFLNPDALMKIAITLKEEQEKRKVLELENAQQKQIIAEYTPKASYYDLVLQTKDALPISQIAKDYGKSAKWMNKLLYNLGVQYQQGNIWLLYQKYAEQGFTNSKTHTYQDENGGQHSKLHTYWTQKGRLFIYDLLKQHGYLPTMELKEKVG